MTNFNFKSAFATAVLSFATTSLAESYYDGCTVVYQGDMRHMDNTNNILVQSYKQGFMANVSESAFSGNHTLRYCADNTIRNEHNQCYTWLAYGDDPLVGTSACMAAFRDCDADDMNQQFIEEGNVACNDGMGNAQTCTALYSSGSGKYLDMDFGVCGSSTPQIMFRSKGGVVTTGNLVSFANQMCLQPISHEQQAQVTTAPCDEDDVNQSWTYYQNGEIVHDLSAMCFGDRQNEAGIMSVSACSDMLEQGFMRFANDDGTMTLQWLKDRTMCATLLPDWQGSSVAPRLCDGSDEQKWDFGNHKWQEPRFSWVQVGCGHGVEMSHAYSEEFNLVDHDGITTTADDSIVDSAKEAMLNVYNIPNPVPVDPLAIPFMTDSYSQAMFHPSDPSVDRSHLFTCDSGINTCMYRSVMSMQNDDLNATLEWVTGYTRCLDSTPICPPLSQFDNVSNMCVEGYTYDYSNEDSTEDLTESSTEDSTEDYSYGDGGYYAAY